MIEFLKYYPPYSLILIMFVLVLIGCIIFILFAFIKKIDLQLISCVGIVALGAFVAFIMLFAPFYSEYQQASVLAQKTNQSILVYSAMPREVVYSLYEECVIDGVKK